MPTINRKSSYVQPVKYKHLNNTSSDYYNTKAWKTLRNAYYCSNPLCELCLLKGISRQAEHIHHKRPFLTGKTDEERWQLLLDPTNLQSLCRECHEEVHRQLNHKKIK